MAPFDGQDFKAFVAPAITPSREYEAIPPASLPSVAILSKARSYVAAGWCKSPFSIDADGNKNFGGGVTCPEEIKRGVKFCAAGAMWRVYLSDVPLHDWEAAQRYLAHAAHDMGQLSPVLVNSRHGQAGVLEMYDRAILAAEGASPYSPAEGRTSILSAEGV